MSMISSLDALEAATDAVAVPRAAVFQPKVKARVRRGGVLNSVPAKSSSAPVPVPAILSLPSERKASTAPVDSIPSPADAIAVHTEAVTPSALENPVPVFLTSGSGKESVPCEDGSTPSTEDATVASPLICAPEVLVASSEDLQGNAFSEQDPGREPTIEPSVSEHIEESELYGSRKPKFALSSKLSRLGSSAVGKNRVADDLQPSSADEIEDSHEEREDQDEAVVETEPETGVETGPERVPTNTGGTKRRFLHSTSQPRKNRLEKDGVALKIDFSKTDLSNPGKLTMREIIRRAEAIERKRLKAEGNKMSAKNDGKQKHAETADPPERDALSLAPQVQVVNGRIVINEQSLTVGAYATSRLDTETYTRVEENAPRLNYNSYRNKIPMERWKAEDTDVFYLALKQFGTDFELIQNLFPGRTRRQVKAKFKKEERNNPRRLQEALAHRPQDQAHYMDMINRLKGDELDPVAGNPFESILAHTKNAATQELSEDVSQN